MFELSKNKRKQNTTEKWSVYSCLLARQSEWWPHQHPWTNLCGWSVGDTAAPSWVYLLCHWFLSQPSLNCDRSISLLAVRITQWRSYITLCIYMYVCCQQGIEEEPPPRPVTVKQKGVLTLLLEKSSKSWGWNLSSSTPTLTDSSHVCCRLMQRECSWWCHM